MAELVSSRPIIQVIDKDLNFCPELRLKCKEWNFDEQGLNFFVVAVLGCQSTGKSTLLNILFGTQFEIMQANLGRSQTTLGVWLGMTGTKEQSLMVFDVEGTDSKERGEEHGIFERKTSLFSLALSEVLLLNLWTTDVGRFEGANYGLLKTVFDLNLQLFTKQTGGPKTLLLFVLRDHDPEETPLEALSNTLKNDMEKLWSDIKKPEKFATSSVHDFFDFEFTSLPHFKFQKGQWMKDVEGLRDRFINPNNEKFLLQKTYKGDVPADGFPTYAESIWNTIQDEKDLDLPSQRRMLSVFRCDEIAKEAFSTTTEVHAHLSEQVMNTGAIVENFGEEARKSIERALDWYDTKSARYDETVVSERRGELKHRLIGSYRSLYQYHIQLILTAAKRTLFELMEKEFGDKKKPRMEFPTIAKRIKEATMNNFIHRAESSTVFQGDETWSFKAEKEDLALELSRELAKARESQLQLYMQQKKSAIHFALQKVLAPIVEQSREDMWNDIRDGYDQIKMETDKEVEAILKDFGCEEEELKHHLSYLEEIEFKTLKSVLDERAKEISMIMTDTFKKLFELQNGVPRKWGKRDGPALQNIYKEAVLYTEKLVDRYSVIRTSSGTSLPAYVFFQPGPDGVNPITEVLINEKDAEMAKLILIHPRDGKKILSQFRDYAQGLYRTAEQEIERAAASGAIPYYVLVLGAILGANEIWWVITTSFTNPFFLFFVLLVGGIAGAIWHLNLLPVLIPMLTPIQREIHTYLKFRLGWSFIPSPDPVQVSNVPASRVTSSPETSHPAKTSLKTKSPTTTTTTTTPTPTPEVSTPTPVEEYSKPTEEHSKPAEEFSTPSQDSS